MSKKEILKPFDLAKAKAGAKLRLTSGENARIVCYDVKTGDQAFCLLVLCDDGVSESVMRFRENGTSKSEWVKLQIVEEVEEPDRWIDRMGVKVKGWCLAYNGKAVKASSNNKEKGFWKSIFATKKQAQAAAAAAQISQIMANDKRFGGVITDEEWEDNSIDKFVVCRHKSRLRYFCVCKEDLPPFSWLAFHTEEQRDLFVEENKELIKQFFML